MERPEQQRPFLGQLPVLDVPKFAQEPDHGTEPFGETPPTLGDSRVEASKIAAQLVTGRTLPRGP